jgi:aspartyl-tRNA(Asn)/glutamyl-tRNA(Gln) amidotransferase subunit A
MTPDADSEVPTLAQAARLIWKRVLSPVELTERCLAQLERCDTQVNAFATVTSERARAAAYRAEQELASGGWRGPLHGIPVGFKDTIDVGGVPTQAQSHQMEGYVPLHDASAAARWFEAGAVSLGKLTTHEFAFGSPAWDVPGAPARNPWRTSHFAGGSSSGAAVSVACGMVLGALGSDTAGSVRSPAALCGVTGFKPGSPCIDRRGSFPLAPSLDALGVIAHNVEDCATLFAALSGPRADLVPDADDASLIRLDPDLRGLRIGVVRNFFGGRVPVSDELIGAIEAALAVFVDAGCGVQDVELGSLDDWHAAGMVLLLAEAFALHEPWLRSRPERYGRSFSDAVLLGATLDAAQYLDAVQARKTLTRGLDRAMEHCDLLIAPIQPGEAPPLDALSQWGFLERPSYGVPFNLSDSPALSLSCGFSHAGLPLALQLIGRRGGEGTVLRAGHAYQSRTDWHRRWPPCRTRT